MCLLPLEAGGHPGNRTWLHRDASIDGASAERSPGRWAARASGSSSRASSNASACHLPVKDRYNDSFTPQHAITDGTTSVTTVQGGTADFLAPELCLQGQMLIREP